MGGHPDIVTLLTDFGTEDGYVGAMKGVLLSQCPQAVIVDISHRIEPFNIRQAAFALYNAAGYFPKNTIHVVVIDPGVGTSRRGIVLRTADYYYIGPDNGVFSLVVHQKSYQAFRILEQKTGSRVSATFHGRDVFIPTAIKILKDAALTDFTEPVTHIQSFYEPVEKISDSEYLLKITHVDHFGNLILNFSRSDWKQIGAPRNVKIRLEQGFLYGIKKTFGEAAAGEILTLWDCSGHLQISQNQGNASNTLKLKTGDQLILQI